MSNKGISRVLIVGSGWVGRQVAARMAQYGLEVWLCDRDPAVVGDALEWLRNLNADHPVGFAMASNSSNSPDAAAPLTTENNWLQRVAATSALSEMTPQRVAELKIELVLECVPEQVSLKKRVLKQLSGLFPPPCIIASNSSYFTPAMTAKFVSHPERFAHMHFHVPVLRESVCDVVGCAQTESSVLASLADLARRIEQPPIIMRREHPGYIFNWLLQSMLKGALELVALDVVDPQQVDQSWKAVTGMPLGPFGIMDQIGLDVIEQVLSNARWADPPPVSDQQLLDVIRPLVESGKLGVKTRAGFYDYPTEG